LLDRQPMIDDFVMSSFIDNLKCTREISNEEEVDLRKRLNAISKDYIMMFYAAKPWHSSKYRGLQLLKIPNDLWIMQEIIQEIKPDLIIETGSRNGASTLWFADQLNVVGKGEVLSIELDTKWDMPRHERVTYIKGSSVSDDVIEQVNRKVEGKRTVMVNLDSDHSKSHVLREMELYSPFVTLGSYMIVEDTIISGHPSVKVLDVTFKLVTEGPIDAIREFFKKNTDFMIDTTRERFQITTNPQGYLRRLSAQ
jgi:cephalosporin hydroxylase